MKGTIDFGEWVIVDNNPEDERQVIQYDPLNDEYTLDKNGAWDYVKSHRVQQATA